MRNRMRILNTKYSSTNLRMLTVLLSCLTTLVLFFSPLTGMTTTNASDTRGDDSAVPTAIIYDNGPFATGSVARNSTAAPAGFQWSEASFDFGSTTVANTTAGFGCQLVGTTTANRCADDFNVPVGQTWTINQVIAFAYQTNSVANPFVGANLRIWSGRPGDLGSTIVFGDTTTNRIGASTDTTVYRIFNSGPPANTATGTTRLVRQIPITVSPAAVLTAGNYWVDFQFDAGTLGNFAPMTTITGTRGVPGWNARQFIGPPTNTGWADAFDTGTPATASDIVQEFPFKLDGSISGAAATPASRKMDFDGDNKSDGVVARASGAAAQATWYISNSGGPSSATNFGLGIGYAGGDIATPEDFDGDGKTDIAVWRSHPTVANFYILQSSNGALRTEQFGKAGDDPSVIDDYDGDGKADVAVFRGTVTGIDPCGASSVWYWRPSGSPGVNFRYACWGLAGDKPYPGDFDGDGKADPSVVRNNAGVGDVYQNRTTAGARVISFGNFTDKYIGADLDADGRNDLISARDTAGILTWYFVTSGAGQSFSFQLGASGTDYIVPGDFDGDNKTDFVTWRSGAGAGSGDFILLKTFTSPAEFKWGDSVTPFSPPDYPVGAYQVH